MNKARVSNQSIDEFFEQNPFHKLGQEINKNQIIKVFSGWLNAENFSLWNFSFLFLAERTPLQIFDSEIVDKTLDLLRENPIESMKVFHKKNKNITRGVFSLIQKSESWSRQGNLDLNSPQDLLEFETIWNPELFRYYESVYSNLVEPILLLLSRKNKKNYEQKTLQNKLEILSNNNCKFLMPEDDAFIRNAIAHGNYEYKNGYIEYKDESGKIRQVYCSEFEDIFDNLFAICNSILISYVLFITKALENKEVLVNSLPSWLGYLVVYGQTKYQGFSVDSMIEQSRGDETIQLNIYCRMQSYLRGRHLLESAYIAWVVEKTMGDRYNRYFVEIENPNGKINGFPIDALKLRQGINGRVSYIGAIKTSLEAPLALFDASKFQTWVEKYSSLGILLNGKLKEEHIIFKNQFLQNRFSEYYRTVEKKNSSTSKFRFLNVLVCLQPHGIFGSEELIGVIQEVLKETTNTPIKRTNNNGEFGRRAKPEFVTIKIVKDFSTIRQMEKQDFEGKSPVAVCEWSKDWRTIGPRLTKDGKEISSQTRIRVNPIFVMNEEA